MELKLAEIVVSGYYLSHTGNRCYNLSGNLKGNKWINLEIPNPEWWNLSYVCIGKDILDTCTYHKENPTKFVEPVI